MPTVMTRAITELSPDVIATALIQSSFIGPRMRLLADSSRVESTATRRLSLSLGALLRYARSLRRLQLNAGESLEALHSLKKLAALPQIKFETGDVRIRILRDSTSRVRYTTAEVAWLKEALNRPSLGIVAVDVEDRGLAPLKAWEWPIRIAVVGPGHDKLGELLRESNSYPQLVRWIEPSGLGGDVDIAIVAGNMSSGPLQLGDQLQGLKAGVACLLQPQGSKLLIDDFLSEVSPFEPSIAVINPIPQKGDDVLLAGWFGETMRELSHNRPIDVALDAANKWILVNQALPSIGGLEENDGAVDSFPVFFSSPGALAGTKVSRTMSKVIEDLKNMSQKFYIPLTKKYESFEGLTGEISPHDLASRLEGMMERLPWVHETNEATDFVLLREDIERAGVLADVPDELFQLEAPSFEELLVESVVAPAPMPPPAAAAHPTEDPPLSPERRLIARVLSTTPGAVQSTDFLARIWIGFPELALDAALQDPLPTQLLPSDRTNHQLDVAFVPLVKHRASQSPAAPLSQTIMLPKTGRSTACVFSLDTKNLTSTFKARIIVSYQNRVLQTAILLPESQEASAHWVLNVDHLIESRLQSLDSMSPADAFLFSEEADDGGLKVTAGLRQVLLFQESPQLERYVKSISELLSNANITLDEKKFDQPEVAELLRKLANYGVGCIDYFPKERRATLKNATRIQVVESTRGAHLPVEFFYDGNAPDPIKATVCPNATQGMANQEVHSQCLHRNDDQFVCPAAFWGATRSIERRAGATVQSCAQLELQDSDLAKCLSLRKGAVFAASARVNPKDVNLPNGIQAAITKVAGTAWAATSWTGWSEQIQAHSPGLLVLLPHSGDTPYLQGIQGLEIQDEFIASTRLMQKHVLGPNGGAPVVLVLGCETATPTVQFLSCVFKFRDFGAALVVATIATIRGRHAAKFIHCLMDELELETSHGPVNFHECFLRVRRKLLASGDIFPLSVVVYGDADWRVSI
jgi:hypothetical protein